MKYNTLETENKTPGVSNSVEKLITEEMKKTEEDLTPGVFLGADP